MTRPRKRKMWQILWTRAGASWPAHSRRLYDLPTARALAVRFNRLYRCPENAYLSSLEIRR